jgi:hypothetical protein
MRRSIVLNIPLQLVFLGCTVLCWAKKGEINIKVWHNMLSGVSADCRVTLIVILSIFMLSIIVAGCLGTIIINCY